MGPEQYLDALPWVVVHGGWIGPILLGLFVLTALWLGWRRPIRRWFSRGVGFRNRQIRSLQRSAALSLDEVEAGRVVVLEGILETEEEPIGRFCDGRGATVDTVSGLCWRKGVGEIVSVTQAAKELRLQVEDKLVHLAGPCEVIVGSKEQSVLTVMDRLDKNLLARIEEVRGNPLEGAALWEGPTVFRSVIAGDEVLVRGVLHREPSSSGEALTLYRNEAVDWVLRPSEDSRNGGHALAIAVAGGRQLLRSAWIRGVLRGSRAVACAAVAAALFWGAGSTMLWLDSRTADDTLWPAALASLSPFHRTNVLFQMGYAASGGVQARDAVVRNVGLLLLRGGSCGEAARVLADHGAVEEMLELTERCDDPAGTEVLGAMGHYSEGRFSEAARLLDGREHEVRSEGWPVIAYAVEGQYEAAAESARRPWNLREPELLMTTERARTCIAHALEARTENARREELPANLGTEVDHPACRLLLADLTSGEERLDLLRRRQHSPAAVLLVAEVDPAAADASGLPWPNPAEIFTDGASAVEGFGGLERVVLGSLDEMETDNQNVLLLRAKLHAAAAAFAALISLHDGARAEVHRARADLERAFPNEADRGEAFRIGSEHLEGLLAAIEADAGNAVRARELLTGISAGNPWLSSLRNTLGYRETRAVKRRNQRPGREPEEPSDQNTGPSGFELARSITGGLRSPEGLRKAVWNVSDEGRSELVEAIRWREREVIPHYDRSSLRGLIARAAAFHSVALTLEDEQLAREQSEILAGLLAAHFERDIAVPLRVLAETADREDSGRRELPAGVPNEVVGVP